MLGVTACQVHLHCCRSLATVCEHIVMATFLYTHTHTQLPNLSTLTPSSAAKIASLCLSPDTITWRDVVQRWLTNQNQAFVDSVQSLFDKYIPKCFDFLSPLLARESHSDNVVSSVSLPSLAQKGLLPQEMCPSEINLISTCYTIFQVRDVIMYGETYSSWEALCTPTVLSTYACHML